MLPQMEYTTNFCVRSTRIWNYSATSLLKCETLASGTANSGRRGLAGCVTNDESTVVQSRESANDRSRRWTQATLKGHLAELKTLPKPDLFVPILNACTRYSMWAESIWIFSEAMGAAGILPNQYDLAMTLNACARGSAVARCIAVLEDATKDGRVETNTVVYNTAIHSCSKAGFWEGSLHLLEKMNQTTVEPSIVSFTAAITACKKGGRWQHAIATLEQLAHAGVGMDEVAFAATLSACEKGRQWKWCLEILNNMATNLVAPSPACIAPAVAACASVANWEQALCVLTTCRTSLAKPGSFSYNAALVACERGRAWQSALDILSAADEASNGSGIGIESLCRVTNVCFGVGQGSRVENAQRQAAREIFNAVIGDSQYHRRRGHLIRGEIFAAVAELRASGILSGRSGSRVCRRLQRLLARGLTKVPLAVSGIPGSAQGSGTTNQVTSGGKVREVVHDSHSAVLQNLFEVGALTVRDVLPISALLAFDHASADDAPGWKQCARVEMHERLGQSLESVKDAAAGFSLAVWCTDNLYHGGLPI